MDVGVSMGLKNKNGSLKLFVMECGCYMKDLDITLNGGSIVSELRGARRAVRRPARQRHCRPVKI